MNKHLLLGTALLVAISAFPQAGKLTKSTGILEAKKKIISEEPNPQTAAAFSGTIKQIKHVTKGTNKIATVSNLFTGSMNVFGLLVSQQKPLQYNKGVNAVSLVARKNGTYTASSNSGSGTMVGLYSNNLGLSWNETCLWSGPVEGRYPTGGIFNPLGNTNMLNAYIAGSGPYHIGGVWTGDWFASKQMTSPGNTTSGPDIQSLTSASSGGKHDFSRNSFVAIDGGLARSMGVVVNDINSTTFVGQAIRGASMMKGVFSAGAFIWSVDSFIPPVNVATAGNKLIISNPVQAWDDAGLNGYVVLLGSRSGTTPEMRGYQPIVYKTTNSGASWSLLPANDFANPTFFKGVNDRLYATNANTNVISANFSMSEGFDAAVDINGQLHFVSMVLGHVSINLDTLGYRGTFGTEAYDYSLTGPFNYPVIYDFYTKSSGGWDYHMVDSMGTVGPYGTSGQPGYGANQWSDGSGAKMDQDARIQISRTDNGAKLYYSWSESDSTILSDKWNTFPDIKMKGFDVTMYKVTPRFNITSGSDQDQGAYYQYMSNKVAGSSTACVTVPFTVTKNAGLNGGINVDTYYLDSIQVCASSFSINPMSPTGVPSINNAAVNYDVINFPNPASDATTIIVGLKTASNFEVVIYSSVGQVINSYKLNGQVGSNEINVDLSSFSSGIYFYDVKVGNSSVTKKLVIQ